LPRAASPVPFCLLMYPSRPPPDLPSFPTRRSSDLLVGGATKVHPAARAGLRIAEVTTAQDLTEIIVAAGLAQNLAALRVLATEGDRKSTRLNSSHVSISYAVFCLQKKNTT